MLIPSSVVLTVPPLLRLNRQEIRRRMSQRDEVKHPDCPTNNLEMDLLINLPVDGFALVLLFSLLHTNYQSNATFSQKVKRIETDGIHSAKDQIQSYS